MKKPKYISFHSVVSLVSAIGLASPYSTSALETTASIGARVEHSNNVNRADVIPPGEAGAARDVIEPRSDVESQIFLEIGLTGSTAQFDTDLAYTFTARDFKNDFQADDEVVDGTARVLWTPLADRFSWELMNNVSDTVRDERLADTPNNRQQRNIIATGPNITFMVSPVDRMSVEYRYVDVKIDDSDDREQTDAVQQDSSDSERQIGRLRWTHSLSSVSDFLVSTEYEEAEASFDVNYTRLLVGYAARLRNGSYEFYIGSNKVEPGVGDDFDTAAFSFSLSHNFGGHSLDLTLVKEATDTSLGFGTSGLRSETFNPRDSNFDSFDIIERQRADVIYQNMLLCGACSVRVNAFFDDQDYQDEPGVQGPRTQAGDQKRYGLALGLVYALRHNVDLLVDAIYDFSNFLDDPDGLEYESTDYALGITYNLVRDFSIGLLVRQSTRDANVEGQDFEELRGGVEFSYRF